MRDHEQCAEIIRKAMLPWEVTVTAEPAYPVPPLTGDPIRCAAHGRLLFAVPTQESIRREEASRNGQ